jgi:ParB family transcriptional regulator, chromosome partitioning protein
MELEHQQLDLRYSRLRARVPRREKRLVASIAEVGQLVPIMVVGSDADADRSVVIDGHKRVRALRKLRMDTVLAIRLDLSELEALLLYRSLRAANGESALEQAWLLEELQERFQISMELLARQFERSASWISRRLALVRELPSGVQDEIRSGRIAPHAATKYLVPMARAKPDDCERMARAIAKRGLSTRQVGELYSGWRDGNEVTRERLLDAPELYLESRLALATAGEDPPCPREWLLKDVEILSSVARRAGRRLRSIERLALAPCDFEDLLAGLALTARCVERLTLSASELQRVGGASC